ncbi:MAG: 1,2-phenylacetyl-CoA epoxidase subunit PaaD [Saprospiraceae bacterium]
METVTKEAIFKILEVVSDPEIPVLSVVDMGVIRDINLDNNQIEVIITPTYSGCPAMNVIEIEILATLKMNGFENVKVKTVLSPAWTTDWLTERGRQRLLEYGIAPPAKGTVDKNALFPEDRVVACPQCQSENTKMISQFGSTACKSMYKCKDCLEPFDYFKCI